MASVTAPDLDTLLLALARGKSALVPVDALAGLWGVPDDEALDTAADLEADGWLTTWTEGAWPVVVLTSRAAELLGLELEPSDTDDLERCRWVPAGSSRPPDRAKKTHERLEVDCFKPLPGDARAIGLDSLPDHRTIGPGLTLLALQRPWPLVDVPGSPCPGCGGLTPSGQFVCCWCLRSSKDDRIGFVRPLPKDKPEAGEKPKPRTPDGLTGGRGKAKGKPVAVEEFKGRRVPGRKKSKRARRKAG